MTMKKALICLSIVAIVVFCTLNVATASTSRPTTVVHNGYDTDARSQTWTGIVIAIGTPDYKHMISTTTHTGTVQVNQPFLIGGYLYSSGGDHWPGATIDIQGGPQSGSTFTYRAVYYGDSNHAPCVSDPISVTAVNRQGSLTLWQPTMAIINKSDNHGDGGWHHLNYVWTDGQGWYEDLHKIVYNRQLIGDFQ